MKIYEDISPEWENVKQKIEASGLIDSDFIIEMIQEQQFSLNSLQNIQEDMTQE